jgi:hypothetical protein
MGEWVEKEKFLRENLSNADIHMWLSLCLLIQLSAVHILVLEVYERSPEMRKWKKEKISKENHVKETFFCVASE